MASRRTQPYRRGRGTRSGAAFMAMTRGAMANGFNPQDAKRGVARKSRRRRVRGRA